MTNHYNAEIETLRKARQGREPAWLEGLRDEAATRFAALGFPSNKHEEWSWTNVTPIAKGGFALTDESPPIDVADFVGRGIGACDCYRVVLVNGRFCPESSTLSDLPNGVRLENLASVLEHTPERIGPYLACVSTRKENAFAALNTALLRDGAVLEIEAGVQLEKPVAIIYIATNPEIGDESTAIAQYPRTLVLAGPESECQVIESFVSTTRAPVFTNAVTEFVLRRGAALTHVKLQDESPSTYHVGALHVHQEQSSRFQSRTLSFGGQLTRNEMQVLLAEQDAESEVYGLCVLSGKQHVDNHILLDHAEPHCKSQQLFKSILDGESRSVFAGKVIVRPHAQNTLAEQSNKNLLLSERAEADAKPQLEIYADDVKCSHGATTGSLDEDALFYLRSRGIDPMVARTLLTQAFALEILDGIENAPLRTHLLNRLEAVFDRAAELKRK